MYFQRPQRVPIQLRRYNIFVWRETPDKTIADFIVLHQVFKDFVSGGSLENQGWPCCKAATGSNQYQKQAQKFPSCCKADEIKPEWRSVS